MRAHVDLRSDGKKQAPLNYLIKNFSFYNIDLAVISQIVGKIIYTYTAINDNPYMKLHFVNRIDFPTFCFHVYMLKSLWFN